MKVFKTILQIGGVVGSIAAIGAAALFADSFADKQDEILETVEYINAEQSILSGEIQGLSDTVKRIENKIDKNTENDNQFYRAWRFEQHNRDNFTPEQMEEILNNWIKKNGEQTVLTETPSTDPD